MTATRPGGDPASPPDLPEEAYAAALASLQGAGPRTLRMVLAGRTPKEAWAALVGDRAADGPARGELARVARGVDVAGVWAAHVGAGVGVAFLGGDGYPAALGRDDDAPAVLFSVGEPAALDRHPRVALVGTRAPTRYGLGVAAQLGAELAAAGVLVLSGLAPGVEGAAHEGAVAAWRAARGGERPDAAHPASGGAPPVAVVAGSVAVPRPRQHAGLWRRVAEAGAVVSEAAVTAEDAAWRLPRRDTLLAALADLVVVVECHARGGAFRTVEAAAARSVPVGAVPGSVRSPASAGTNALLADGCFVVRDASDVLVALGLATAGARGVRPAPG